MSKYDLEKLDNKIKIKHGFAFKGEYFANEGKYIVLTPGNFHEKGGFSREIDVGCPLIVIERFIIMKSCPNIN